jgi:hypothetical protein
MKKALAVVAMIVAAALVLRLIGKASGGVEAILERMPEDAPPKWLFTNISTIRENTDRILERLPAGSAEAP